MLVFYNKPSKMHIKNKKNLKIINVLLCTLRFGVEFVKLRISLTCSHHEDRSASVTKPHETGEGKA